MNSQKHYKLGKIATYINGFAFKPDDWGELGLPIIRIQNLTGSSNIINHYSGSYKEKYLVKKGDILISWSATLGIYEWQGEDALLNQHIFKVVFNKKQLNKRYFVHIVSSILEKMSSETHGSTMKHITKSRFDDLDVFIPDLSTQQKIANELDVIEKQINLRKQQLAQLDQLVKSRFVEMFGHPSSDHNQWPQMPLKSVCHTILGGGTPSKSRPEYYSGDIPWVTPKDMKSLVIDDSQDHITNDAISNSTTKLVPAGSVLMVIRSGILKHTLPVAINANPVAINQDMKAFVPKSIIIAEYLLHYFRAIEAQVLGSVRSFTADNIDFKVFQSRKVPVPPTDLQRRFAEFVTLTDKSKFVVQQSITELETLKQSLMQKYFGPH